MHELASAGLATQIEQLQEELVEYAELTSGVMSVTISLDQIDELGAELIRARLVRGLSQRALAEEVGIAEGVFRRYERDVTPAPAFAELLKSRRCCEIATPLPLRLDEFSLFMPA
jgi:HTH-type transcriptional regulator / antitoxin HipB